MPRASPHPQHRAMPNHLAGPFPVLCLLHTAPGMGGLQWSGQAGSPVINGWSRLHTAVLKNNSDEAWNAAANTSQVVFQANSYSNCSRCSPTNNNNYRKRNNRTACTPNKVKKNNNDLKSPPQETITLSMHCLSIWSLRGSPPLKKPKYRVLLFTSRSQGWTSMLHGRSSLPSAQLISSEEHQHYWLDCVSHCSLIAKLQRNGWAYYF